MTGGVQWTEREEASEKVRRLAALVKDECMHRLQQARQVLDSGWAKVRPYWLAALAKIDSCDTETVKCGLPRARTMLLGASSTKGLGFGLGRSGCWRAAERWHPHNESVRSAATRHSNNLKSAWGCGFWLTGATNALAAGAAGLMVVTMVAMAMPHEAELTVAQLQAMLEADDDTMREVDDVLSQLNKQIDAHTQGSSDPFRMDPDQVYAPPPVCLPPCLPHCLPLHLPLRISLPSSPRGRTRAHPQRHHAVAPLSLSLSLCGLDCSSADPLAYKAAVKTQQDQRDGEYFGWVLCLRAHILACAVTREVLNLSVGGGRALLHPHSALPRCTALPTRSPCTRPLSHPNRWMNQIHGLSKQIAGCEGDFFVVQQQKKKGQVIKAAGISQHVVDYTMEKIKNAEVRSSTP